MMKIVDEYKEQKQNQSKLSRKKSRQLVEKGRDLKKQFALEPSDVENIFDILEKEYPEL